jgi:cytidine deaminase
VRPDDEMIAMLEIARGFARAPVSGFAVGAVARGRSGELYPGANLEFAGAALGVTVHAEQAAVANAWAHGERGITDLAVTDAPCGHCRQFLNELRDAESVRILVPGRDPVTLAELLPAAFGPADLRITARLMDAAANPLALEDEARATDPLAGAALAAACRAYAPYTGAFAGVALELADGSTRVGSGAENAAYNPGLPALQAALVQLAVDGVPFESIRRAVLVEAGGPSSQRAATETLLATVAPGIALTSLRATRPS